MTFRSLLCLTLLCVFAACDTGRAPLDEDEDGTNGGGATTLDGDCTALIDGERFEARTASARIDGENDDRLDLTCDGGATDLIFRLQPETVAPTSIALGTPGNRAQLSVGDEVTVTVLGSDGAAAGEIVLSTYTRDLIAGTFSFDLPSFGGQGDLILVRRGEFRIELP